MPHRPVSLRDGLRIVVAFLRPRMNESGAKAAGGLWTGAQALRLVIRRQSPNEWSAQVGGTASSTIVSRTPRPLKAPSRWTGSDKASSISSRKVASAGI